MTFNLDFMTRGNKALTLTLATMMLMAAGSVMFFIGPDNTQDTGDEIINNDIFRTVVPRGNGTPMMSPIITNPPVQSQPPVGNPPPTPGPTPLPTLSPTPPQVIRTPAPTPPAAPLPTPATNSPVTPSPIAMDMRQYPFAVVYECDWNGNRLTLTTKTISSSVVRLCIEAPPLPASEEPVEISYLSWFVFHRQPYEGETLEPLKQHAVILAKPDPFGLTVLDCKAGAPVCKFATDLRDEFFETNAFLQGRGELYLQYTRTKTEAGYAPISIYFLLSSLDIKEPLQLGRRVEPGSAVTATPKPNNQKGRLRWPQRKPPLFVTPGYPGEQPP